jgi:predicted metalloprotease with PDZ domain
VPHGNFRRWRVARATEGDVPVRYRALPREVSAATRPGPLYDLRAEGGGLSAAGINFLALPENELDYRVRLKWDLSGFGPGAAGVWSLGEGEVETVASMDRLAFSYYAAGPLHRYPAGGGGRFSMYWFGEPPFDTAAVADQIRRMYEAAAAYFEDADSSYRIFVRKQPYASGGGTALRQSFMFGWHAGDPPTPDNLRGLLAHEITHNWPAMQGEHGETSWYSEGAAEYYSILFLYRAGLYTTEEFRDAINRRASGYYTNSLQRLSNKEAAERFWSDGSAQRVPYGRGFMYLAAVDAAIRAKSGGARTLGDLVREMRKRQLRDEPYGIEQWLELLTAELGPQAKQDYEAMVAGRQLVPPPGSFGPCFRPEAGKERVFELGFDARAAGRVPGKITGLVPGSAAERAGLREGDEVQEAVFVGSSLVADEEATLTVKVLRGGAPLAVTFLPRGAEVESWQWVRVPEVPESECMR